ncbi:MAG: hypothetical protein KDD66_16440 [Bdellovibrionales bacterium]|nr:hypothetical protein [Bdellovibrionales bacterium]
MSYDLNKEVVKILKRARKAGVNFMPLSELLWRFDAEMRTLPSTSEINAALTELTWVEVDRGDKQVVLKFLVEGDKVGSAQSVSEDENKLAYELYRKEFGQKARKLKLRPKRTRK